MNELTTKICKKCGVEKPIEEYYEKKSSCKYCYLKYKREYNRIYRSPNRSKTKRKHCLKSRYGLTLDEYDKMVEEQDGVCFICGKPETAQIHGVVKRLAIDHNHETGEVRKLLCTKCNVIIGLVDENIDTLLKIIQYLNITCSG